MATPFYFPNYPYNDLREDPFLLEKSNAYNAECNTYIINAITDVEYQYTDCFNNIMRGASILAGQTIEVCSTTLPTITSGTADPVTIIEFDVYRLSVQKPGLFQPTRFVHFAYKDLNLEDRTVFISVGPFTRSANTYEKVQVFLGTVPTVINSNTDEYTIEQISGSGSVQNNSNCYPNRLSAFDTEESKYRHVFNSPETSFGQPFLGDVLKIENVIFGDGDAHFVQVKDNALYKLITKEAQEDALKSSEDVAVAGGGFDAAAMFTAYQAYLQIYLDGITRKNYGWSYNSIASYDYYANVENGLGIKQRTLENAQYLVPGVQSVGEDININNFQRESSVYLRTNEDVIPLPYPSDTPSLIAGSQNLIEDASRFINSQVDCSNPEEQFDISVVSYYGSIKNIIPNQWGQMYSYETIDTGFQHIFDNQSLLEGGSPIVAIFGGDTFISKFAFKTKLPFFIDNRVGAPDDSDIFFDELGNVAYPEYWHSARSILYNYTAASTLLTNVISIKAHNFDCPNSQISTPIGSTPDPNIDPNRTFYDGKMYLFAYGIPNFYCESSVNVDLRQAFNNKEGDFYPHVSSGIPDEWVQETNVSIVNDNTYYYNVTYSKQNKENFFSHLPVDWEEKLCFTVFPFRAIYSEQQLNFADNTINNWLIYRPLSMFDFPQNYGDLISLDGIQNRAILARFENKSLLYNTLLTINTSNPQAAYLGSPDLFRGAPPIDFAETDLGYVGSQHKFLLKIPQGQVTVDAKRGQVFLIAGNKAQDLSILGMGLSRFLNEHLPFEILEYFPEIDIDNHFNGIGLHGVYDSKYDRIIISKLDYTPLTGDVKWDSVTNEFYIETVHQQVNTTTTTTTGETLSASCDELGSSASFAVLGASTVTNTGNTVVTGDLGLFPGTSVTGFPPGIVIGDQHVANGTASSAQDDAEAAFVTLGALPPTGSVGADIGGTTITPGVYETGSSLDITGEVTFDAQGDPDAIFVFQIPSTLITASAALVTLINGAKACNIYWLVGSSATLGTTTEMKGNIIANISITFNTGANLLGRAFALTGAVTLDDNEITRCECSSTSSTSTVPSSSSIRERVYLTDTQWFCNKSWTLSFNLNTQSWISFHSYIPNWYIAENNFFYSGLNGGCDLEVIAVEFVPPTTITSTTPFPFDCVLEGNAQPEVIVDCSLEGDAQQQISTTTTTTTNGISLFVEEGVATASYDILADELNKPPVIEDITVSGTPEVGGILTATITGHVNGPFTEGTHEYQWYTTNVIENGTLTPISGATSPTYQIDAADVGLYITVRARYVQNEGLNTTSEYMYSILTDAIAASGDISHAWEDFFNIESGESVPSNWNDAGVSPSLINLGLGQDYDAAEATKPSYSSIDGELVFQRATGGPVLPASANINHPPVFETWIKGRFTGQGTFLGVGNNTVLGMNTSNQFLSHGLIIAGDLNEHVFRLVLSGASSILQIDNGVENTFTEGTSLATKLSLGSRQSGGDPVSFELKRFQRTDDGVLLTAQEVADKWAYHGF